MRRARQEGGIGTVAEMRREGSRKTMPSQRHIQVSGDGIAPMKSEERAVEKRRYNPRDPRAYLEGVVAQTKQEEKGVRS
jgi:hypothetical protein